jgi:hypothetical protein
MLRSRPHNAPAGGTSGAMTLAMSWDEWAAHDAVALAARVRVAS